MIRYAYTQYSTIPAPFVHATLRCSQTGKQTDEVPAQIDSGSDWTVLPARFVDELGLVQMGQMLAAGFGGKVVECPVFIVEVAIRGLQPITVKILTSEGEPFILLGRDVLNHFRILLDGPRLALEIE